MLRAVCKLAESDADLPINNASHEIWNNLSHLRSPASLPTGVVFSLLVSDPRATYPPRTETLDFSNGDKSIDILSRAWPRDLATSVIWDKNFRDSISNSRKSTFEINNEKGLALVPGSDKSTINSQSIPIIVYQRGETLKTTEFSSGYTLIIPKKWGIPFWTSLIATGAQACGQQDIKSLNFEQSTLSFPFDHVSTRSFNEIRATQEKEMIRKYLSRPPQKRGFNFDNWPSDDFSFDYSILVEGDFHVIYSTPLLMEISRLLKTGSLSFLDFNNIFKNKFNLDIKDSLIPVGITVFGKGAPSDNTVIYRQTSSFMNLDILGFSSIARFRFSIARGYIIAFVSLKRLVECGDYENVLFKSLNTGQVVRKGKLCVIF